MAAFGHRRLVLKLYKNLMKESQKFSSYNFRLYAIRRVRDAFKENKDVDPERINHLYEFGIKNLEVVKRQVVIGKMYETSHLVIEGSGRRGISRL